jgi:hypothetical protein
VIPVARKVWHETAGRHRFPCSSLKYAKSRGSVGKAFGDRPDRRIESAQIVFQNDTMFLVAA